MNCLQRATHIRNLSGIDIGIPEEVWVNDIYTVQVRRHLKVPAVLDEEGKPFLICWLSIKRNDQAPITDWRHMQWIKNQLVGEECEGCELFPAESRLVDGANQYHLWVFENPTFRFPFGFTERSVTESNQVKGTVQRPFPANRKPFDLQEQEQKLAAFLATLKPPEEEGR